ncbi:MAG: hypothetical protein LQ341_003828 [Variospora aurantia]|nr:MAG: hypothetical protein LQ341_003828 [Variospora aurantia]
MSAYAYPPSNPSQNAEAYRASPTGSNVSLPSINLPPIRTSMDTRPQSQQGQQHTPQHPPQQPLGQPQMVASLPPPMYYPAMPGQSLPPPQHMSVTSDPNQPMRYPLPPSDGRMMSGGRHKKEIKRRTKTGCLTCRKRRIKCDENHPHCNNCKKSKRTCAGYDPIFKAQPGPPAIQPALTAAPSLQSPPTSAPPYPPPPQGYVAASSQPYAPTMPMPSSNSPDTTNEQHYDYPTSIDPTLAASLQARAHQDLLNGADPQRESATASPYPAGSTNEHSSMDRSRIDDLIAINGVPLPALTVTQPLLENHYQSLTTAYQQVYGPHIDKFLETQWFVNRGLEYVLQDARLCERLATLIARFNIDPQTEAFNQALPATQSLEASVIWSTMSLARRVASQNRQEEINAGVLDAAKRFETLENMLLGQYLYSEAPPQTENINGTGLQAQLSQREREFWRLMHKFLTIRDDEASASHELDETLAGARGCLDVKENRDVIYSIALVRLHGGRENLENTDGGSIQDKDLGKAKKFLRDEAEGKGNTQVIQRICGMAMRAWTLPR